MNMREPHSINDIRTAIRELSSRAELAHKEGRPPTPMNSNSGCRATATSSAPVPDRLAGRRNYPSSRRNVLR